MLWELIRVNWLKPFLLTLLSEPSLLMKDSTASLNFIPVCLFLSRSPSELIALSCYHYPYHQPVGVKQTKANTALSGREKEHWLTPRSIPAALQNVLSLVIFRGTEHSFMLLIRIPFQKTSWILFHFLNRRGRSIFQFKGIQIRGGNERLIWSEVRPLNRNADMIIKL